MAEPLHFHHADAERAARVAVIAEAGVNHNGSVDAALRLVDAAADAGADAVKFQRFDPATLLAAGAGLADYQAAGGAADAAGLLGPLVLPGDAWTRLADAAAARGIALVVTPFSPADCRALRPLATRLAAMKIASPDAVNPPLLVAAAAIGRPLIVSTGAAGLEELGPAVAAVRAGGPGSALLHCVSAYPTPPDAAALGGVAALRSACGVAVGYSDHTAGVETGGWAVAAGACVLEKHLTLDRSAPGPDHAASLEPAGFADYTRRAHAAAAAVGPLAKSPSPLEAGVAAVARQSVAAARDLPAGTVLAREDLAVMRPGTGIPAAELGALAGRRLRHAARAGHLLPRDALDPPS
ncbi:N-acetylneuraminate synthase family protein [Phycisphaera mikurensis]|uniref:Putative sialic acid synthase n=1 Tax=Phycisphaera mikurensis (strain NBRC 102666 / KCTC 22515 / FYK2301M01) TaxID=1142394 RepID=I0IIQ5_PHYMF|nr:N-acetylneuraminate synthase family protein [Phycisphaera mikurensis]MBB6442705.1 N-acetylneuraminate synthase/N,N'-diacetyllegionaminate synthase [Phycisphaera mikurensis]BAM05143.1 putative sialic acid synthase [Phycisphaera mikurensis NBRC 102666]